MIISEVFKNNDIWITNKLEIDPNYFKKLSEGQNPEILYIGCSDSRVSAEELMGVNPGEVFVHRNIANMVIGNDLNVMSVLNYAINSLQVDHVVVCGHYFCGGVKAAMQAEDLGILNPWLRNIRDVFRIHKKELNSIEDETAKYNRLVELNVQEQCINVAKTAEFQKAYKERNIKLHGWIFDIKTGKLIDLNIDIEHIIKDIKEIYNLG